MNEKIKEYKKIDFPKNVVIVGAGGHGIEIAESCKEIYLHNRSINLIGFLDDDRLKHGKIIHGVPVLGDLTWINDNEKKSIYFVCSIGDSIIRKKVCERALNLGYQPTTLIHPKAGIHCPEKIGKGVIIQPGSQIAVDVIIEDFCHINFNCSVGHNSYLGKYTTLSPLTILSGFTNTYEGSFFGSNAIVLPNINIGEYSKIGAGSVVTKDIEPYTVNIGSPTRIIRRINYE